MNKKRNYKGKNIIAKFSVWRLILELWSWSAFISSTSETRFL